MSKVKQTIRFDFESELARVRRRVARLQAAVDGSADITWVTVREHKVRAHNRAAHTRYVITLRRKVSE